ncbi:MAG: tyrosine-type recombinase/integrase [Tabrizicola sp.]|uniref:tyrosine-type recombinase/integrase n=1 Tax=Tabrizicola sp. TaxID=2005166 RepID=UPI002AB855F7|nr:tyrosine-type recombinase/integrase [Tabrizicola sp.]MDZ4088032.1 tyrosine-type recombinase/integrase [Tabrizicola sp.]
MPVSLRQFVGRSELTAPLCGERRAALKQLPAAVAVLQRQLALVSPGASTAPAVEATKHKNLSVQQIALRSYADRLEQDRILRETTTAWASTTIDTDYAARLREGIAGKLTDSDLDELVGHRIAGFRVLGDTNVRIGSTDWRRLAVALCAAEYEALERVVERDEGDFAGKPRHPLLQPLDDQEQVEPADLLELWEAYVAKRQKEGSMQDGGRRQVLAVKSLIDFTKTSNANDLTKKDIHAWHDHLLAKLSVKTIAKVYLPTIRSLFSWAVKRELMNINPAEDVSQVAPKTVRSREAGYTDPEALMQLTAALTYQPKLSSQGKVLENIKVTAAKRWVPLLCAFTGARIGELTQLRREDLRHEQGSWIARITPDAGSVKTKQYRDVPLHPQLIELGFSDYFEGLADGPIFNMSPEPSRNRIHAQKLANRLRDWLHEEKLVPKDLQPCHGWRHRFKTVEIELGISERVIDAIQGHAGRRAADDYGDVTIKARCDAIARFPAFNLGSAAVEKDRTGQTSEK